ncbi:MAG: hypothetical protein KF830_06105 [Planctomycetes bacterium]|nr:hypothetical protein [Planctomycetota bacterium]
MRRRALGAALLLAAAAAGQQPIAPATAVRGAITADKHGLVLPAGEFTVGELIEAAAAFLGRNYLYDPDVVAPREGFVLQRSVAMDAIGSEEVLGALLSARNLAAVPLDEARGVYQVVALDGDPRLLALLPWRTPQEILRRPRLREPAVTALELRSVDARQLAAALRQQALQPGAPTPWFAAFAAEERLLLLRGHRDQLAQVIVFVQQLERATGAAPAGDATLLRRVEQLERELAELRQQVAARAAR